MLMEKIKELKENKNFTKYAAIIGIIGMILILISSFLDKDDNTIILDNTNNSTEKYIISMETKLTNLITSIDGVGRATVMVTLESGIEYVYAQEERLSTDLSEDTDMSTTKRVQKSDNTEKKYILVDGENGKKKALIQKEMQPVVQGVVVACDGGDSIIVKQKVTEIITTALNISSTRVCITKISK